MAKKEIAEATAAETSAKKNPNVKFVRFDMNRPKMFNCTKDHFVTVTLYKEMNIMFEAKSPAIDLKGSKDAIISSVGRIISLMRCEGVQKYYGTDSLRTDRPNYVESVLIPYSGRQDLIIKNINNMLKQLSDEGDVVCKTFVKNVAMLQINTTREQKNVFIKGFVSASHETNSKKKFINGKPTFTKVERNTVKGQTFLSNSVWNTDEAYKDIDNYNRYSMTLNRISIYDLYDGKTFVQSMSFKRSLKVVVYEIVNNETDNTYKLIRNDVAISLCLRDREGDESEFKKKDAIGAYVENIETTKTIQEFNKDVFYENGEFLLTSNEYLRIDEKSLEIGMLKNDIEFINEDIFKSLEKEDVVSTEEQPKKKNKKNAAKKKVEKPVEEPAFNEVGSLADIEDVDINIDDQVPAEGNEPLDSGEVVEE